MNQNQTVGHSGSEFSLPFRSNRCHKKFIESSRIRNNLGLVSPPCSRYPKERSSDHTGNFAAKTMKMKRLVQQSMKGSHMSQARLFPILMFSAAIAFAADSFAWKSSNDSHMGNAIQAVTTGMPKLVTCPDGRRVPANPGCKTTIGTVTSGMPNLVECLGGQRVPAGKECPQPNNQNPKMPIPGYSR